MIRGALILLLLVAVIAVSLAASGEPGRASVVWLGWRLDTTAATAAILLAFLSLFAVAFWRAAVWIAGAPRRQALARAESRRRQASEILTRGFLSVAAGDGAEARRCAQKAADLAEDQPALVRVLAAQAAETAGDLTAAQAAYSAMLSFPEMRLAGRRGLMSIAQTQGDTATALEHAREAYNQARTARWAWRALFEGRLEAGEWSEALDLVEGALNRKIVTPLVAERARAALLAASAAALETAGDAKLRDQAMDYAVRAAKLKPEFAPGAVIAARLLCAANKRGKAEDVLEQAWAAAPHPALFLAYRDLIVNETPRERARRLQGLIDRKPGHRETRVVAVEQALLAGDPAGVRAAVAALKDETPTARLCGLYARAAWSLGEPDEARAWIARGAAAPQEPDWSDLDPEGRAFAYTPGDWTRLVSVYAETGELAHPRYERRERVLSDLPELPSRYEASAPFVSAAETGAAPVFLPDDPGFYDAELAGPADEPAPVKPAPRRRRASAKS